MHLNELYLDTKYEVSRRNSLQDMTSSLGFYHFWENLTLTFDLDFGSRSSALGSLNALYLGCTLVPSMKSVGEIASEI